MTLEQLQERLSVWHFNRFGTSQVDLLRTHVKGSEEWGELAKAILKKDWTNAGEELCDCLFVMLHICRALGMDLMAEAESKLNVIERRLKTKT